MNKPRGWHLLTTAALPAAVTIRDLTTVTNLSRRTIRDLITEAGITPIPGCGPHGALSYELAAVLTAATSRQGKGNRRSEQPTPPATNHERHALVVIDGYLYAVHMTGEQATQ